MFYAGARRHFGGLLSYAGASIDVGMYFHSLENRLLQRSLTRRSDRHRPETTTSAEQRSPDRAATPSRCFALQTALAAGGAENHLQVGGGHLQSPTHRNTSLSQSPSADPRLCAESSVVRHSSAGSAFHKN